MASPGISQLITTTLQQLNDEIVDDVIDNNAILKHVKEVKVGGGRYLSHPIFYAENPSFQWYSGWEQLSTQASEIITSAEYAWKQASCNVQMSGLEEVQNAGEEELINLLTAKITNMKSTFRNKMAEALYSDGTGSGGKEIGGLQLIIADTPSSGVVGGIDASVHSFWRNVAFSCTGDGSGAATASNIQGYLDSLWVQIYSDDAGQSPDFAVADNTYFNFYKQSLQAFQRITDGKAGNLRPTLEYNGIPVYLDGGKGGNCPTKHLYFVNSDHLMLQTARSRAMTAIGGDRLPLNQDGSINFTFWAGNLTCGSRSFQGVLIN
jgi:hypothetical protein